MLAHARFTPTLELALRVAQAGADLIARVKAHTGKPVLADISTLDEGVQAAHALERGAWAVCVESAITRPRWITERFVAALGSSQPR